MTSESGPTPLVTWTAGPSVGPSSTGDTATLPSRTTSTAGRSLAARERLERQHEGVPADLEQEIDPGVHPGLQEVLRVGDVDLQAHRPGAGSSAWTTRATLPENCRPGYASLVSRTTLPTATRATSRSGTSSWTLTGLISCRVKIPIEALLVAAAWLLTAAPTSRLRWEMYPLKGATIRVSSRRICAMRWA